MILLKFSYLKDIVLFFSEEDVTSINSKQVSLYLVYKKGMSDKAYVLTIEK
jgi:hypothetical protein